MLTAGEKLRQIRLQKNLTLDEAEKATRIKRSFLSAIERNDYSAFPSPTYAQGFVKNYALFLGVSRSEILPLFKRQYDEQKAYDVLPKGFTREKTLSTRHVRIRRTVLGLGAILLVLILYLLFQFRSLFLPPPIHLSSPEQHATVSQEVTVSGQTSSEATVYINGSLVGLDSQGNFTKTLMLFPGDQVVTVVARNRFGKETKVERTVVVKSRT